MNVHTALPPKGTVVRVINTNRYALVIDRVARKCTVKYLDESIGVVYASNLVPIRKHRPVY